MTTLKNATTKEDEVAEILAQRHYEIEPGITRVFRLRGGDESDPKEPVKLLEVNRNTVAAGIRPVHFGAHGVPFATVIVQITPEEFDKLGEGVLKLPNGWTMDREYPKPGESEAQ